MHRRALLRCVLAALGLAMLLGEPAAADESVDGHTLRVKYGKSFATLDVTSRDPDFPFPEPGTGDSPEISGATIWVFLPGVEPIVVVLDGGSGLGRWRTGPSGRVHRYRGRHPAWLRPETPAMVRLLTLNENGRFRLQLRVLPGLLVPPLGSVGIRVRIGVPVACMLFAADAIERDDTERFFARRAPGDPLADDCSNSRLDPLNCGAVSGFPECGGACPDGEVCTAFQDVHSPFGGRFCMCSGSSPCGGCPDPLVCTLAGSGFFTCAPVACASPEDFPACADDGCGSWTCAPYTARVAPSGEILTEGCFCAPPGPCDAACGGSSCPPGQSCEIALVPGGGASTCGCVVPEAP